MQCSNCKAWMPEERQFCTNCGKRLRAEAEGETEQAPVSPNYASGQRPVIIPHSEETNTVGIGAWIGIFLLLNIPLVNIIMCIVWACSAKRQSLKNFARATIICVLIVLILAVVTGILFALSGETFAFSIVEELF